MTYIFERYRIGKILTLKGAVITAIIVSVFGIAVEFIQDAMDMGRSGDLYDALADTIGSFAAIPFCIALHWIHIVVKDGTKK